MDQEFYQHLLDKKQQMETVPSNEEIALWALKVIGLLYPERAKLSFTTISELKEAFAFLKNELYTIMEATGACHNCDNNQLSETFFAQLPELYRVLNTDVKAIFNGDPAAKSEFEVVRTYPGFYAISFYRIAHALLKTNVPLLPRILTEYAHSKTGIDIHPAANIGEHLHIDHGTGTVIGETCTIGNHVKLYQGVTLGAMSVDKTMANIKRHPTVEDGVVIYSGATILGGDTVIGANSIIGGNVWLTKSVPPGSVVYHKPNIEVIEGKINS
ncbi:serine O-acetyltransferase EpsC [Mucilaginibacter arboris]|uniref:Serine acetyltransferase n=1 Tax=Mucilaginibacter arboris TaxID=2682090 RepID=A0A7K1SVX6_9SPHI|nr:serine O-acetyltransferase EpsC [Mucilaginibacter arboris]MVN21475.1 serine acetyltransferase [Mucilaginibacter arboris]